MEMRAIEETSIAEDLIPPLPPLASALHDSSLTSHCSACFSPLPFSPTNHTSSTQITHHHVLYCSPHCSSIDSSLHFHSSELHLLSLFHHSPTSTNNSSDLRLSLRLLHILRSNSLPSAQRLDLGAKTDTPFQEIDRIAGLMTNCEMLMSQECVLGRIRDGAKAMAAARKAGFGEDVSLELLERVLCLVMTNAVEVQDEKTGCGIGVAVYGTAFSWINHSCSPNACYRFSFGSERSEEPRRLTIFPAATEHGFADDHVVMERNLNSPFLGQCGYGPKVIVRSIKALGKGEEVTIAYTDLLQPKETRQAELWLKYRFNCSCKRCSAAPATYVDCALQAISTTNLEFPGMIHDNKISADEEVEKLIEDFDYGIADYLSFNNPELCCKKLENLLSNGNSDGQVEPTVSHDSHQKMKLHLFNHVSINAYTTLASAYKVSASDMLASGTSEHKLQSFNLFKLSAAYSLLLAGVTHHLFMSEPSLIASTANFWINAGESLLSLARILWDVKPASHFSVRCQDQDCFLANIREQTSVYQLEELSRQQLSCTESLSSRVWSKLHLGSSFLKLIQNPVDFRWIESAESVTKRVVVSGDDHCNRFRSDLVNLSRHCLKYGALLSSICSGFPLSG